MRRFRSRKAHDPECTRRGPSVASSAREHPPPDRCWRWLCGLAILVPAASGSFWRAREQRRAHRARDPGRSARASRSGRCTATRRRQHRRRAASSWCGVELSSSDRATRPTPAPGWAVVSDRDVARSTACARPAGAADACAERRTCAAGQTVRCRLSSTARAEQVRGRRSRHVGRVRRRAYVATAARRTGPRRRRPSGR